MKVLFSDILLGNYCCKQHYKLHISFCEVEKCVTFPPRIGKVFMQYAHMHHFTHKNRLTRTRRCVYQHVWQFMRLHLSLSRKCQAHHGLLVRLHRNKNGDFNVPNWTLAWKHTVKWWWMFCLYSIWLIFLFCFFYVGKPHEHYTCIKYLLTYAYMYTFTMHRWFMEKN